jgi:hypothetical protein
MAEGSLSLRDIIVRMQQEIQQASDLLQAAENESGGSREEGEPAPGTTYFVPNLINVDLKAAAALETPSGGETELSVTPLGLALQPESGAFSSIQLNFAPVPRPSGTVEVPEVRGDPVVGAIDTIHGVGLEIGAVTEVVIVGSIAVGTVYAQDPEPGSVVSITTKVDLEVIKAGQVEVPDVIGKLIPEAVADLRAANLACGTIDTALPGPGVAQCTVLLQDPSSGTEVTEGSEVDLTVALPIPPPDPLA